MVVLSVAMGNKMRDSEGKTFPRHRRNCFQRWHQPAASHASYVVYGNL